MQDPRPSTVSGSPSSGIARAQRKTPVTIVGWSVVGHDRIAGNLMDAEAEASAAKRIITSPVLRVRLLRGAGKALVKTQSGTVYLLAHPGFDAAQAQDFLQFKSKPVVSKAVV